MAHVKITVKYLLLVITHKIPPREPSKHFQIFLKEINVVFKNYVVYLVSAYKAYIYLPID